MELQIHHTGSQNGSAMFEVIRSEDMKRTAAVALLDPAKFSVEGHPAKQFLPELRWYLEDYLQTPFGAYPQLAESVVKTMKEWGVSIFDALFTGYARDWYQDAKKQNFEGFRIKITSDSPEIMSWPWEALYSGDDGWPFVAVLIGSSPASAIRRNCQSFLIRTPSIFCMLFLGLMEKTM